MGIVGDGLAEGLGAEWTKGESRDRLFDLLGRELKGRKGVCDGNDSCEGREGRAGENGYG